MSFLDEIDSFISKEFGVTLNEYRYINISGKYLYIEGHCGIKLLSENEISFNLKKKVLSIKGDNLIVKYFDVSTAVVQGQIIQTIVI